MRRRMDLSLRSLEQAVSIRRQIDSLERRLASLLGSTSQFNSYHWQTTSVSGDAGQVSRGGPSTLGRAERREENRPPRTCYHAQETWRNYSCWTEAAFA